MFHSTCWKAETKSLGVTNVERYALWGCLKTICILQVLHTSLCCMTENTTTHFAYWLLRNGQPTKIAKIKWKKKQQQKNTPPPSYWNTLDWKQCCRLLLIQHVSCQSNVKQQRIWSKAKGKTQRWKKCAYQDRILRPRESSRWRIKLISMWQNWFSNFLRIALCFPRAGEVSIQMHLQLQPNCVKRVYRDKLFYLQLLFVFCGQ